MTDSNRASKKRMFFICQSIKALRGFGVIVQQAEHQSSPKSLNPGSSPGGSITDAQL